MIQQLVSFKDHCSCDWIGGGRVRDDGVAGGCVMCQVTEDDGLYGVGGGGRRDAHRHQGHSG